MTVIPRVMVGGAQLPITSFTVTGGAYGSTGSMQAESSLAAMEAAGIDVAALAIQSPGSLPVDIYISAPTSGDTHLYSGEYVTGDYDYNSDTLMIHSRDWSGPLVDQKRALTSVVGSGGAALAPEEQPTGVSTQNQKLSKIVSQIAAQFSLVPDIRLNSDISNSDADWGAVFGDTTDTIMTSVPQSLWGILTRLARQSGNIVYVTAEKHLVFGAPGAGLDPLPLSWRLNQPGIVPLERLRVTHNPRRNMTFRVLVLSYDPTNQQLTKGQAYVVGQNYKTGDGNTVHAGAWGGAQASQVAAAIGTGSKSKQKAIPLYTYHMDGLTASQAQSRAEAIAADISKREVVASCMTALVPDMAPGQPATLTGLISGVFSSHQYYVTSYHHRFRINSRGSSIFETDFTLLDRQPAGKGKSVSPKNTSIAG